MAVLHLDLLPADKGWETPELPSSTASTFSRPLLPPESLLRKHYADVIIPNGPREADRIFMTDSTADRLHVDAAIREERSDALAQRLEGRNQQLDTMYWDRMALALDDLTMVKCVLSSLASMENDTLELEARIRHLRPWTKADELEKTRLKEDLDNMKTSVRKRTTETEEALSTTLFQSAPTRVRHSGSQRNSGIFGFAIGQLA